MTDKEIIIDGVDVSGCDFYEMCGCIDDNHKLNDCKDNPYCYYKQLKQLEAENAKLKEENIEYDIDLAVEVESHKSDLKRLKQYYDCLQEIKEIVKDVCSGCTSECDCDEDCYYFVIKKKISEVEE